MGATRACAQAYLAGLTFALAASPCSTPVLATLLAYVASRGDLLQGAALLLSYTSGWPPFALLRPFTVTSRACADALSPACLSACCAAHQGIRSKLQHLCMCISNNDDEKLLHDPVSLLFGRAIILPQACITVACCNLNRIGPVSMLFNCI